LINEKKINVVTKHIGRIRLFFLFNQDALALAEQDAVNEFTPGIRAEIRVWVNLDDFPEIRREEKIFDSKNTWSLYRSQKKYFLYDCSLELDSLPNKLMILEPDFKSGEIFIRDGGSSQNLFPDPLGYPLNQILMIMLLSSQGGILLHACGIDDSSSGYLFLGNSGHGKSTMARIWFENKSTVLNDDRIIVEEKDGALWMYGTPWHGDFGELCLKGVPISKIFFLRKGEKTSAVARKGSEAISMLLARAFLPFWDKKGMNDTLHLCHLLISNIPCYELTFVPNRDIIEFVRNI
jgi:hypothetical protein